MARLIVPPAGFIEPMPPTLVQTAPDGEAWVHEIKYDGFRTQLKIAGQNSRAYTRNGYDWTDKYGIVVAAARALKRRRQCRDPVTPPRSSPPPPARHELAIQFRRQ